MSAPIGVGEQVAIRDLRQVGPWYPPRAAQGRWFVLDVVGVAARIGRSPLARITCLTPLSNLRRTEASR